jgi:glycosyltransferase involved in cell wall biosynthesis
MANVPAFVVSVLSAAGGCCLANRATSLGTPVDRPMSPLIIDEASAVSWQCQDRMTIVPSQKFPFPSGSSDGACYPRVSVVMPTLNEARNLAHVFARLPVDIYELIIVDGHSIDGTRTVARQLRPDARIVIQTRKGKGNALACGFAVATGDIIAMMDADGSTDPREIPRFTRALLEGADFAMGSRFSGSVGGGSSDITRLRRLGNHLLGSLVNVLCKTQYSDLCYGLNLFWRRYLPVLGLDAASSASADSDRQHLGDGFEIEALIRMRIAKARLAVIEVASYEYSRLYGKSKLRAFNDGIRVVRAILLECLGAPHW